MAEATSAANTECAITAAASSESGSGSRTATAATTANAGGTGTGTGEGSSSSLPSSSSASTGRRPWNPVPRTLGDVMREPSITTPDVVVLDNEPEDRPVRQRALNPREDLWLTTADGRYSSSIIPLRVGPPPDSQTFYVHKHVLLRYTYFEKALCGGFLETETQSMDFPEEDPAIFHFLVAYLYEGRYEPIKPIATVLLPDDKGKGNADGANDPGADSDVSSTSSNSDASVNNQANQHPAARERLRRERQRRREERYLERMRQKHPGLHRPSCHCPQCLSASGPPCWSCRAPRAPPPPPPHHPAAVPGHHQHPVVVLYDRQHQERRRRGRYHGNHNRAPPPLPPAPAPPAGLPIPIPHAVPPPPAAARPQSPPPRISGEDLATWLLAYELDIDVYILANKFCLHGFMKSVARSLIDLLESAGPDAAVPQVLYLCQKVYAGLPENDPLLKMIFARVGFLQPWRSDETDEANEWLIAHPEIASLLLMEMAARRDVDEGGRGVVLPSMESLESGGMYGNYSGGPQGILSEWMMDAEGNMFDRPGRGGGGNGGGGAGQWMGGDIHHHHVHHHGNVRGVPVPYVHGGAMWNGVGRRIIH